MPIRAVRLLSPAAPNCFAKLLPMSGKYTSLMSLFLTKDVKTLGSNSFIFNSFSYDLLICSFSWEKATKRGTSTVTRSEERRVGKEYRYCNSYDHRKEPKISDI